MRRASGRPALAVMAGVFVACGGGGKGGSTPPPAAVVASITITPSGGLNFAALQATQQLTAVVRDQNGTAVAATVQWTSDDPTVATVSAAGLVTAVKNGQSRITARAGAATASEVAIVAQRATALAIVSGSGQTGIVGTALSAPLVASARDAQGNPVPGATVSFAASGGGNVGSTTGTAGANGEASTTWTLGTSTTVAQSVIASVPGAAQATVTFTATPVADAPVAAMKFSGDNQRWSVTKTLPDPISIRVVDRFNNGVAGTSVTYATIAGGGTVSAPTVVTDANGEAKVSWTLGVTEGGQSARGTLTVPATSMTFFATATRLDVGNIGAVPFKVGCSITIRGSGFDHKLSNNIVTIDSVPAKVTGGSPSSPNPTLIVTVPTLPNPVGHLAYVEVTAYGSTFGTYAEFDPDTNNC